MKEGREGRVCGHREVAVRLKPNNSGEGGQGEWKGPLRTHTRRGTKRTQKVKIKREKKTKKKNGGSGPTRDDHDVQLGSDR